MKQEPISISKKNAKYLSWGINDCFCPLGENNQVWGNKNVHKYVTQQVGFPAKCVLEILLEAGIVRKGFPKEEVFVKNCEKAKVSPYLQPES